jgi:hypothetical protein
MLSHVHSSGIANITCTQTMANLAKTGKIPSCVKKWTRHEGKWGMHTYTLLVTLDFYDHLVDTDEDGKIVDQIMFDFGDDLLFYYTSHVF